MFVISPNSDGAQYDVVSLAASHIKSQLTQMHDTGGACTLGHFTCSYKFEACKYSYSKVKWQPFSWSLCIAKDLLRLI